VSPEASGDKRARDLRKRVRLQWETYIRTLVAPPMTIFTCMQLMLDKYCECGCGLEEET